ncbi:MULTISPECIES: DUF4906 domain-containing protein [Bacteroides]|jgi:hypothetical protein|uniref:DUF4906 domain-containing protein n=1 Tax=Bacteroides TaxID=816 RepID=UPI00101E0778|nr:MULTISPECIES: DUF4906 domain-containing protein [Bacteroides]MBU8971879.1 DUF4906 domain-containing protein [Bacteroides eggerthii]MBU8996500.1 DUF4906 domain-containing protein [Bacteroides eggerthii]MCG4757956.1 DUF4906 domain-containing protein [Bacteroides eggerthii]
MKITSIFGLCIAASLCFLSCTDGDEIQQNITPNVDTMPVKLALGMAPMHDTGGVTRARGDNSLDLVLGEEADKAPDYAGAHSATDAGTQMNSATDAGAHPQTRASLTDAQEDAVSEICVFQFENATNTLKYSGHISLGAGTLTTDISLATGMGACTVYVLANVGDLTSRVAYGSTLADFKTLAAEVTSGKGTGDNLPMCGSNDNFDSNTANTLAVSLTRSVAKVSLNLTLPNGPDVFTVRAIKLMNVAKKLYYVESTAPTTSAELTDYTSDNSNAITWYIPENKAGTTSLTDWKDRYEGNAPATATYILIEGSYTPQNGTARDVAYAIYLGDNDPADFNVTRNTKYTVNASIRGTNLDDGRVLVGKDLSAAGTRTANCYVVKTTDANKWYRFKATVRGNGAQTAEDISYTGAVIPAGDKISPVKAGLVWETRDNNGTVHTLDYVGYSRNGYIVFKLGSAPEGNAVVAAKDGASKILWSWHIWATAAFDGDNIKVQKYETRPRNGISGYENITKRTFNMMDRNLGAASAMPASKTEAEVIKTYGLLYQFGRKDPFPGPGEMKKTGDAELIPFYDANGQLVTKGNFSKFLIWSQTPSNKKQDKAAIIAQLAYVVENPSMFVMSTNDKATQYGGDGNTASYNWLWAAHRHSLPWKASNKLWGSGLITESGTSNAFATKPVTKTIYDPCPYGYHMPEQDVWTNFSTTTTGYEATTETEFNVVTADKLIIAGNADGFANPQFPAFGRRFLTTGNSENTDGSNVAFYPAVGTRFNETRIENLGLGIYYWSASPYDNTGTISGVVNISATGSILYGNNNMVSPVTSGLGRMSATPVRCVRGN